MYYKMQASVRLRSCGADGDPEQKTAAAAILYTAPPEDPWTIISYCPADSLRRHPGAGSCIEEF